MPMHNDIPQVEGSDVVFKESFISLNLDTLRLKNGQTYDYYTLHVHPFAVCVLAMTKDGRYVLNQEYRHPTKNILLSCPGGFLNENEDPLVGAQRELNEETGYHATSFELMGSAFPYAGISSQKTYFVKASHAILSSRPQLETAEIIQSVLMTKQEVYQAIRNGVQLDGTLCTALFFDQINPE